MEAGDFGLLYYPQQYGGWETTEYLAQELAKLKYDAWTPGERELVFGKEKLAQLAKDMACETVSANITDKNGTLLFKDRLIKTIGGLKVGITGVTTKTVFEGIPPAQNPGGGDFDFKDPFESVKPVVEDLRKKADCVVVLAHLGPGDARRMAEEVPGIDVIVVGHNPGYMYNPDRVGDVFLVRAGTRGQYASKLLLSFDGSKKITDYKGTVEPLNEGVIADATMSSEITKFQDDINKKTAEFNRQQMVSQGNMAADKFLGDETCARCHSDVYTKWSQGPHAKAFQTLVASSKQGDKSCVGCHVTGFGDVSGYQLMVLKDNGKGSVDTTDATGFRNVQCEACHGKGTMHGTVGMVTKVAREVCITCHDPTNDPKFDYDKAIASGQYH